MLLRSNFYLYGANTLWSGQVLPKFLQLTDGFNAKPALTGILFAGDRHFNLVAKLQLGNAVEEAPAFLNEGDESHPLLQLSHSLLAEEAGASVRRYQAPAW
ncbi:MAG: hypothetical protein HC899_13520 [Leptolyngbyaceae cyanobacterium SM1_4_3]|nr:hypothetical protein [Leptolyngbyaceae cyanobacterium SM1_4_3]NJN92397.1 hypothetical protein [Leptolyngbyaceae cyanobacterium SL_5_14]